MDKGRLLVSAQIIKENKSHRANGHWEIRKNRGREGFTAKGSLAEAAGARSLYENVNGNSDELMVAECGLVRELKTPEPQS